MFLPSVAAAYVLRAVAFCVVGTVGFWTTRVDAASRLYLAAELLLSGRLVPIVLYPAWLASAATWLPFRYTFGFPIEVLTTSMSTGSLIAGFARPARVDRGVGGAPAVVVAVRDQPL